MKTKIIAAAFLGWLTTLPMAANAWDCKLAEGIWDYKYQTSINGITGIGVGRSIKITVNGQIVNLPSFTTFYTGTRQGVTLFSEKMVYDARAVDCKEWVNLWALSNDLSEMQLFISDTDTSEVPGHKSYKRVSPLPSISQTNSNRNSSSGNTNSGNTIYGNSSGNGTSYGSAVAGGRAEGDNGGADLAKNSLDEEGKNMSECINLLEVSGQYAIQNRCDTAIMVKYCAEGSFAKSSNNYAMRCGAGIHSNVIDAKDYGKGLTTVQPGGQSMIAATPSAHMKMYACEYPRNPYLVSYNPPKGVCGP